MASGGPGKPVDYKHYGQKGNKRGVRRQEESRRIHWLIFILIVVLVAFVGWKWWLAPEEEEVVVSASLPPSVTLETLPQRQKIFDQNLEILALSFPVYAVYVKPLELRDVGQATEQIAEVLELDIEKLAGQLRSQRTFVWLGKSIPSEQAKKLVALNVTGLYLRQSAVRYYPHYNAAAQVLGYVQDNHGLSGVELYYDAELLGKEEQHTQEDNEQTVVPGKHVVLTLDLRVQAILEKQMALLSAQTHASSVSALAVNPVTGAILAYAQHPSFDPNAFWLADSRNQYVKLINTPLKPGAISGLFRYGAALYANQEPLAPVPEMGEHLIVPRAMKIGSTSRGGHWWVWPMGGYISDELSELPDPTVSDEELLAFQDALGISCADAVDLPEKVDELRSSSLCGQGYFNGISLLSGFCRLINGGEPIQLHLKKGGVDEAGNFEPMIYQGKGMSLTKVSQEMLVALGKSAGSKAKFMAVEYLAPLKKEEMIVTENLNQSEEELEQFDGLLLAAGPGLKADVALLIHVENGRFQRSDASPMRQWAGRFFNQLSRGNFTLQQDQSPVVAPGIAEAIYTRWLRELNEVKSEGAAAKVLGKNVMPDLRGMSLRKALGLLQPLFVEVDIHGAGKVITQLPVAGVEVSGGQVELSLGQDEVVAEGQVRVKP